MKNTIAYLCNTKSWGGLEMNQIRNALWMKNRGHQVFAIVNENSQANKYALIHGLDIISFGTHKRHYDFIAAWKLYKILTKCNIEVLIVRNTFDMSIAASISFFSRRKIKTIFCMEMQLSFPKKQFFRTWRYQYIDAWCCPLHYLKNQVLENTNINPVKVHVIPSGIDLESIHIDSKEIARKAFQIAKKLVVFGVLGRIDPKKGQLLAFEAFENLNNENCYLLIQGEINNSEHKHYIEMLKNRIERSSLKHQTQLVSFEQDVNLFYSAIDYLIVPSENETVGMVTIEALARGITILGSNIGGTKEILENGKLGLLFETNKSKKLTEKMKNLFSDVIKFKPEKLIEAGKQFDKNRTCSLMEDLIFKLIKA